MNYRSIAINLAGQPNVVIIFQSQSRLTVSKALKFHVEVHILFLIFLLEIPGCKDHIYWGSGFPELTLTYW